MIRLWRVVPWPALLVLFVLALPQSPGAAEEKASGVKGDAKKRGHLDGRRRLAGRRDDPVRPPGRPLPGRHGGREGRADHLGAGLGLCAALLAGRQDDRLLQRPGREHEPVADGRRRIVAPGPDRGEGRDPVLALLDAGRAVRPGAPRGDLEGRHPAGGDLDVPPGRRHGRQGDLQGQAGHVGRPGREPRRPLRLPDRAQGRLLLHAGHVERPVARVPLRPEDGRADQADDRPGRRPAAGTVARRQTSGVRAPPRRARRICSGAAARSTVSTSPPAPTASSRSRSTCRSICARCCAWRSRSAGPT